MTSKTSFEEMMFPYNLKLPTMEAGVKKRGKECCELCRTCVFHRPRRKDRICVFRECPFIENLSTSTYPARKENRKRNRRRCVK